MQAHGFRRREAPCGRGVGGGFRADARNDRRAPRAAAAEQRLRFAPDRVSVPQVRAARRRVLYLRAPRQLRGGGVAAGCRAAGL